MKVGQTSIIYFGAKILGSLLGLFATIYFTRTLGEEVYGYYAVTIAVITWLGIIKSVGLTSAVVKRMSEGDEADEYFIAGTIAKSATVTVLIFGVLTFQEQINNYVGQPVAELVVLILLASLLSVAINSALKGTNRVHIYAPLSTLKDVGRYSAMGILVFAGWELTGMLFGYAVGTAFVSIIGLWFVRPSLVMPEWRHFKSLFDFAKYSWLGKVQKRSFNDMDILVLGLFVPANLTGIYAIAYSLGTFLNIFGNAISTTLFPEMSKISSDDNIEKVAALTESAIAYSGLFLIPGVIGGVVIGDRVMQIFGPGFKQGEGVLVILLIALLIYTYNKQLLTTFSAVDRPDLAFRTNTVFIVSNVSLNFVLVWQIGWVGAAIATAVSAGIGLIMSLFYIRRLIDLRIPYITIGYKWIAAVIMGIAVYLLRYLAEDSYIAGYNEVFVAILSGLGAIIYFLSLFIISQRFRKTIEQNVPSNILFFLD